MPYNPQITDQRGQLRAQGIVAAGNNYGGALANMGQQFQQFQQNRLLANQAVGQIEGALKANPELFDILTNSNQNPNGPQPPSQAAQAFLKLQKNGALPMQDAALLSQYVQTYAGTKAAAQQQAFQRAQMENLGAETLKNRADAGNLTNQGQLTAAQAAFAQAQAERMNMQNRAMGNAMNGYPQGGLPQNGPVPSGSGQIGAPQPSGIPPMLARPGMAQQAPQNDTQGLPGPQLDNPFGFTLNPDTDQRNFMIRTMRMGAIPDSASIDAHSKDRQAWLDKEQQIGFAPLGNEYDDQGNATARKVVPVSIKPGSPGKLILGDKPITLDPTSPVTLPLIDPASGRQMNPSAAFGKDYNPNAKGAQEKIQSSYEEVKKAQESLSNANFFRDAVHVYVNDPQSSDRMNALLGTERGGRLRQFMTGRNPVDAVKAARGEMYKTMINNLQNDKTGANGLNRITQTELENLQAQYGGTEMPNYVQVALADNVVAIADRNYQAKLAYNELISKGIKPSDADEILLKDPRFNKPVSQIVPQVTVPDKIPKGAIVTLKAKPQLRAAFDAKYGTGSADFILNGK